MKEELRCRLSLTKTLLANSNGPVTLTENDQHGVYLLLEELEEAIKSKDPELET